MKTANANARDNRTQTHVVNRGRESEDNGSKKPEPKVEIVVDPKEQLMKLRIQIKEIREQEKQLKEKNKELKSAGKIGTVEKYLKMFREREARLVDKLERTRNTIKTLEDRKAKFGDSAKVAVAA